MQQNTSQRGFCAFFFKEQKNRFFNKKQKNGLTKEKNQKGCVFKKKWIFLNPGYLSIFFVIFPWSHDLEQVTSLSVWLGVRRTSRVKVPVNEEAANYWHLST